MLFRSEVGFGQGTDWEVEEGLDLLSTYAGQASLLKEWSQGAQINTDRNLRLQYLAGMSMNSNMGEQNLASIRAHYRFPEHTFIGSDERIRVLMQLRFRPVRLR